MGPNTIQLKHPGKKKLKSNVRKAGPYDQSAQHQFAKLYSSSNQAAKSQATANRMFSMNSNGSNSMNGSVVSKQFQQVKLRQDMSIKSNKSPHRYSHATKP